MRPPSIPFAAVGRLRRELANLDVALTLAEEKRNMRYTLTALPPNPPVNLPPGDLSDAVKPGNPPETEFNEGDDEEEFSDFEDEGFEDEGGGDDDE